MAAGFPCQPHSGLAAEDEDEIDANIDRLGLALRPLQRGAADAVLLENAPGLLHRGLERLTELLMALDKYEWHMAILDPCVHLDVPMARERVYLVGLRKAIAKHTGAGDDGADAEDGAPPPRRRSRLATESTTRWTSRTEGLPPDGGA